MQMSLASALIYYTAVIVILSMTTLAGFSLFFSLLPSVFPIVNPLCLAGFYWFLLYVSRPWSLKTMIYFECFGLANRETHVHAHSVLP